MWGTHHVAQVGSTYMYKLLILHVMYYNMRHNMITFYNYYIELQYADNLEESDEELIDDPLDTIENGIIFIMCLNCVYIRAKFSVGLYNTELAKIDNLL